MLTDSPHAVWWNRLSPSSRLDALLSRHRGVDDRQYQQHMREFSRLSFSELDVSGRLSVQDLYRRFGS